MPYMYCNQQGCNETVKLPAQYCAKHKPSKLSEGVRDDVLSDITVKVDVDKVSKTMNRKKTTT